MFLIAVEIPQQSTIITMDLDILIHILDNWHERSWLFLDYRIRNSNKWYQSRSCLFIKNGFDELETYLIYHLKP